MRYGRILTGITDTSQVETPQVGLNLFIHPEHGTLWAKDTTGAIFAVYEGANAGGTGAIDAVYATTATPNDIVVDIPGIAGYTNGLVVNIMQRAGDNTGAMTIDVNSLGVKNIKKLAGVTDMAADDVVDGVVNRYMYILASGEFEWIGQVVSNDAAIITGTISFADYQPNAGASGTIGLTILPRGFYASVTSMKHNTPWSGGTTATATVTVANADNTLVSLNAIDVFRAAGPNVGAMAGAESSTTLLNSVTDVSEIEATLTITADVIDNLVAGDYVWQIVYSEPTPVS